MRTTSATTLLVVQLKAKGLPRPEFEFRFHPVRRFRFDVAFVEQKLAVELDGATWVKGRHVTGVGHQTDATKRNLAVELGWRVLTYTPAMVNSGEAIRQLERILGREPHSPAKAESDG